MSQSASETMPLFPQITSTSRLSTRSGWFTTWRKCLRFREQLSGRLWLTFASVMVATFIARVPYIFPNGFEVNLTRGENYHFRIPLKKAFLWTHIASILPAGLLAVIQFVPRVRAQAIHVHRIVGRIVNVLVFISVVTAWGIARVSLGGDLAVQSGLYLLGVMILWSAVKSWMAIRRLQIDEHREWVIRTWSYTMSIVTLRVVMVVSMITISIVGGFYQAIRCEEVAYIINNASLYVRSYPQCQAEWTGSRVTHVAVEANIDDGSQLGLTAALNCVFGMSTWVGIWIHAIGTEYYVYKTKDESDRLREISARRQIAFCTPEATTDNRK